MKKRVEVEINTACAHCGRSMRIDFASDLRYRVRSRSAKPLVFEPDVDWQTFREPNIIGSY